MAWTPDKIKLLKKLWQKGKSTVEIARELGISKNAVVGKVHRLKLVSRPSPIQSKSEKPKEVKPPVIEKEVITLMDLKNNSCRWPFGDPGQEGFHFCGKDCQTGKPYCPEHCKQAYTSLKELALESAREKKDPVKLITITPEEAAQIEQKKKKTETKEANAPINTPEEKAAAAQETSAEKPAKPVAKKEAAKPVKAAPKSTPSKNEKAPKPVANEKKEPVKPAKPVKQPSKDVKAPAKQAPKSTPAKAEKKPTKAAPKSEKKPSKPAAKPVKKAGK